MLEAVKNQMPLLDELEARTNFAGLAEWLLTCPLFVIAGHHEQICAVLKSRCFYPGVGYVDGYVAQLHACRDGRFESRNSEGECFDLNGKHSDALLNKAHDMDDVIRAIREQKLDWWAA